MPNIETVIQSGAANAWLLLPTAVLLGALHALEPGHSKSMMTAFIVAIQGTAAQAVLCVQAPRVCGRHAVRLRCSAIAGAAGL